MAPQADPGAAVAVERLVPGSGALGCLLVHGLTGTPAEMMPVASALAGRYPLWVTRVAGHATDVSDLAGTSWREWYASASCGAEALLAARRRLVVIGLSMGALLAMRLAVERAPDVAGIVLLSPAVAVRRGVVRWLGRPLQLVGALDARLAFVRAALAGLSFAKGRSDIADEVVRAGHPGYRRIPLRALLNLLALQRATWRDAARIRQDALVIHAVQDHTCPVSAAEALFAALGSPAKRLVRLDDSFHVVTVDRERARVLVEIEEFLAAVGTGSWSTASAPAVDCRAGLPYAPGMLRAAGSPPATPDIDQVTRWDHAHLWHPFTQMQEWLAAPPLVIVAAEGNYLVDAAGRRYLDGVSSLWCNVHGHRRREIDLAIGAQLERVAHTTLLGLASPPSAELAARLAALAPSGLTRVFYSDAGATAVEIALKLALQYWRLRGEDRPEFVALTEAYHGDTLGAMSIGFSEPFHRFFRPLLAVTRVPSPYALQRRRGLPAGDALAEALRALATVLAERRGKIAAVVLEPVMQGAAGMWPQPLEYLPEVRALTRAHDTLLVCDEVATGFGRTARLFACDHTATTPDLMAVGKGLTGGYLPLAATLATEEIFTAFLGRYEDYTAFFHGHTFTGNALACAAALASLDLFGPELLSSLPLKADLLSAALADEIAALPHVAEVRQRGLMVGIELMRDPRGDVAYAPGERIGHRAILAARRRGVILRPLGDVLVLMPPLSITADEVTSLVAVTAEAIRETTGS